MERRNEMQFERIYYYVFFKYKRNVQNIEKHKHNLTYNDNKYSQQLKRFFLLIWWNLIYS